MRRALRRDQIPDEAQVTVYPARDRYGQVAYRRVYHLQDVYGSIACGGFPKDARHFTVREAQALGLRACRGCLRSRWAHIAILGADGAMELDGTDGE